MTFVEQRALAERALQALAERRLDLDGSPFPAAAARLKAAREHAGLSHMQLQSLVGEEIHLCQDLEWSDDELFTCADLRVLLALGRALNTSVASLLFGSEAPPTDVPVTFAGLAERLRTHLDATGQSAAAFADAVGWSIEPILEKPAALADYNVVGLRDICRALSVDWLDVMVAAERAGRPTSGCS